MVIFRLWNSDEQKVQRLYHDAEQCLIADMLDINTAIVVKEPKFDKNVRVWFFDICIGTSESSIIRISSGDLRIDKFTKKFEKE